MYRAIVRRQYRRAWRSMNAHDYEAILRQLAPRFAITFVGDTALGGTRTTVEAQRAWFQRLFHLFPDASFEMTDHAVDGPPWNTRIAGTFTIRATVGGEPYTNAFAQFVRLRWGRITGYTIYEDSLRFWRATRDMAALGVAEAAAPPIT
jgi:ketosteroid isomerase-like protein